MSSNAAGAALRSALTPPGSAAGNILLGCLRDLFNNHPGLWSRFGPSCSSWRSFVELSRNPTNRPRASAEIHSLQSQESQAEDSAAAECSVLEPPQIRFLTGGLSNLQWVVNDRYVLRVSTKPAPNSGGSKVGATGAAADGPKGSLDVERAVFWALAPLSCEMYGHGSFTVDVGVLAGEVQKTDVSTEQPSRAPVGQRLLAEYTILEFVEGPQLPEPVFQRHVGVIASILADHHVHLHKKLAAIEECGAQPEAVGGEDEGPYARAVLSQLRNTHHVRDVVRQWCFLDGRGNSENLPKLFGKWEQLAGPLGFLDRSKMELCHHDTHARNFLFRSKLDAGEKSSFETPGGGLKPMVMIDWEFAGMSHPGFDLGNMLCETFMDYDENVFDMPNVGKRPGDGCLLGDRVAEVVAAYNLRRAQLVASDKSAGSAQPVEISELELWFGICTAHLQWAAWSRCSMSSRELQQKAGSSPAASPGGGDGDDIDNFPYERYAQARESLFVQAADTIEQALGAADSFAVSQPATS